ncbi:hypothetical protein [Mucilaginibacter celer]|uniref:hypothetical protein n=1 Tax=Mucilaginibacter celer TaxID=2305508 RepID=UPI0013CF25DD|nr:hypothetical protein [Mucilaginibacter celer]
MEHLTSCFEIWLGIVASVRTAGEGLSKNASQFFLSFVEGVILFIVLMMLLVLSRLMRGNRRRINPEEQAVGL